jgi:hypothetical protein
MNDSRPTFVSLASKTIVAHTLTYVFMGVLASHFLDYAAMYARPDSGMRSFSSPWVMAGPLFQPLRGLIFASVFHPLRAFIFGRRNGWLLMAWMLIALGILSTFGPASGSIEGMVYTPAPILLQLRGWFEIVPQAILFSGLLCYWVNHPERKWLNWILGGLFFATMAMITLGLLMRKG